MVGGVRKALKTGLMKVEGWFDALVGAEWNPFYQLGALSFFFFWVATVSGVYLFIFFDTSIVGAYESVEYMTHVQWYAAGVMRSFHRYGSDAMVVTTILHMAREFALDRYRGVQWFAWMTGVPMLWLLYGAGIGGYWLVWDKLAQYVAIITTEWLDYVPIFGEPIARNFLTRDSLNDRFFTLLVFMHIALPLFLLFAIWIHILRVSRAKLNPPKPLAAGILLMLLALSFWKPALSQGQADLGTVTSVVGLDWFYLALYPLMDTWPKAASWALVGGFSVLIAVMPWLPRKKPEPAAKVDLQNCNGCGRCFADCPFGAVIMVPRTDGRPFRQNALVNPALCTSCGICAGACPTSTPFRSAAELITGIDLPHRSLQDLRTLTAGLMADLAGPARVVVFGCDQAADVSKLAGPGVAAVSMPCIAALPPSFIDYALDKNRTDGVFITGCRDGDCFHRLGVRWMEQRLAGTRDPYLRDRVPRERLKVFWAAPTEFKALTQALAEFRTELQALPAGRPAARTQPDKEPEMVSGGSDD